MIPDPNEPKMVLIDANSPEAMAVATTILKSLDTMVPYHVQMGAVIRLFSSVMIMCVDEASPEQTETVRGAILTLMNEITEAVRTWPNVPQHMRMHKQVDNGKAH